MNMTWTHGDMGGAVAILRDGQPVSVPEIVALLNRLENERRSAPDHNRLFALVKAAFDQWPEAHEFTPDNPEHLRSWLLCKAGHRDVTTIPVEYADDQPGMLKLVMLTVEAAIKAAKGYAFIRPHNGALAVFSAKSISWDTLDQKKFWPIRDDVTAIIESAVGVTADQLLKEKAA